MHIVWVAQTNPPPAWLQMDRPLSDFTDTRVRHRFRYYRKIYQATPSWVTRAEIAEIYRRAHEMRQAGFDVEVDHVVPLNGELVCGLHCPANLKIICRKKNAHKSNRYFPGMPFEQSDLFSEPEQLALIR